jgi:hypothetical protein
MVPPLVLAGAQFLVFVASGSLAMNERAGGLKFADDDSWCFAECHIL